MIGWYYSRSVMVVLGCLFMVRGSFSALPATDGTVPAHLQDAVALLDLSKFPALPGASRSSATVAVNSCTVPKGDVGKAIAFYREKLAALGWKEETDAKLKFESAQGAQLFFYKEGFILYVSMGVSPNDGELNAVVIYLGNIDARVLPRLTGAKVLSAGPDRLIYETELKPEAVRAFFAEALKKQGWLEYKRPIPKGIPADAFGNEQKFTRHGLKIELMTMEQEQKLRIFVNINLMSAEWPILPDADAMEYENSPLFLLYHTSKTPEQVSDFYSTELSKLGWKAQAVKPGKKPGFTTQTFEREGQRPLKLECLKDNAGCVVQLK